MKSKLTINCETYLMEEAKEYGINFSKTMEEALRYRLNFLKEDIEGIDIELIKLELAKEEKKLAKIQQKTTHLREMIQKAEGIAEEKKEKQLKQEKEKLEQMNKCINCGDFLQDKSNNHEFKGGSVCNSCFMTATGDQVKQWNRLKND